VPADRLSAAAAAGVSENILTPLANIAPGLARAATVPAAAVTTSIITDRG
jgi:hypothetical protein